jgi:hypothetical protein
VTIEIPKEDFRKISSKYCGYESQLNFKRFMNVTKIAVRLTWILSLTAALTNKWRRIYQPASTKLSNSIHGSLRRTEISRNYE